MNLPADRDPLHPFRDITNSVCPPRRSSSKPGCRLNDTFDGLSPLPVSPRSTGPAAKANTQFNAFFSAASPSIAANSIRPPDPAAQVRPSLLCGFEFASSAAALPAAHERALFDAPGASIAALVPDRTPDRAALPVACQVVGHSAEGSWNGEHVRFGIMGQEVVRVVPANHPAAASHNGRREHGRPADLHFSVAEFLASANTDNLHIDDLGSENSIPRPLSTRLFHHNDEYLDQVASDEQQDDLLHPADPDSHQNSSGSVSPIHLWCGHHIVFDFEDEIAGHNDTLGDFTSIDPDTATSEPALSSENASSAGTDDSDLPKLTRAFRRVRVDNSRARPKRFGRRSRRRAAPSRPSNPPGISNSATDQTLARSFLWGADTAPS